MPGYLLYAIGFCNFPTMVDLLINCKNLKLGLSAPPFAVYITGSVQRLVSIDLLPR
jgi:hypothetical protein